MRSTKCAKTAHNDWRDVGRIQVAMYLQLPQLLVLFAETVGVVCRMGDLGAKTDSQTPLEQWQFFFSHAS